MISIHHVRTIRATHHYSEANYVELTFQGNADEVKIRLFVDCDIPMGANNEFAAAIAKAVNGLPTARDCERTGGPQDAV